MGSISIYRLRDIITWPTLLTLLALAAVSEGLECVLYLLAAALLGVCHFDLHRLQGMMVGLRRDVDSVRDYVVNEISAFASRFKDLESRVGQVEERVQVLAQIQPQEVLREVSSSPRPRVWQMATVCIVLLGALNYVVFDALDRELSQVRGELQGVRSVQQEIKQKQARMRELEKEVAALRAQEPDRLPALEQPVSANVRVQQL